MPLRHFDLVITSAHGRLPPRHNLLDLPLPLMRLDPSAVQQAAAEWRSRWAHLPRPWVALLVGGAPRTMRADADFARHLVSDVRRLAGAGSVLVTTSRRTARVVTDAIEDALQGTGFLHRWSPAGGPNPYLALVGLADECVVTGDSISMLVETARLGKCPVIYSLPSAGRPRRWHDRVYDALLPHPSRTTVSLRLRHAVAAPLLGLGLLDPPFDHAAFHDTLVAQRLARRLEDSASKCGDGAPDDLDAAVARVRALLGSP
jgi:mitochondrial fission protein ELM1